MTALNSHEPSQPSLASKIKEVGFHSVVYGIGNVTQSAVQFLLIPILTTRLATGDLGAYYLIQMASVVAGAVFYLGMTSALPRSYFDYEMEADRKSVFTTAFLILLVGAFAQVVLGLVAGARISSLFLHTDRYRQEIFWAFLGGAFSFINQFFFSYLRFLRRSVFSIVLSLLSLVGSIVMSLYYLHLNPHDLVGPFKGMAWAQLLVALIFLCFYGRRAFTWRLNRSEVAVLLHFGIPTVISSVAGLVMDWADRMVINRMLSMADVGIYSVGYKLGSAVNVLLIVPFSQIFAPMVIEYRKHSNIETFFSKILTYYFLLGGLSVIFTAIFIKDLLPILAKGQSYAGVGGIVVLVMIGYVLYGTVNILNAGLIFERKVMRGTIIFLVFAVVKFVINLLTISKYGINGAAVTTAVIYAMVPVALYWQSRRFFSFPIERAKLVWLGFLCFLAASYTVVIEPHYQVGLVLKLMGFLVLVGFLIMKCVDAGERGQLRCLVRRG